MALMVSIFVAEEKADIKTMHESRDLEPNFSEKTVHFDTIYKEQPIH
jgi:hypothetical protein